MRVLALFAVTLAPLGALAAPTAGAKPAASEVQDLTAPSPCVAMDPPPTEDETHARFDKFANAFLVTKNITEAFTYIAASYIVCKPPPRPTAGRAEFLVQDCLLTLLHRTTTPRQERLAVGVGYPQSHLVVAADHRPRHDLQRQHGMASL